MNYTETGYPCAACGAEWVKTDDGLSGCLNCECELAHPDCAALLDADAYDESEFDEA